MTTTAPASTLPRLFTVHAATAALPGMELEAAVDHIHGGIFEPLIGAIGVDHIQLCPQNAGQLDEAMCERLVGCWPDTAFRPHANPRVLPRLRVFDASTPRDQADQMFELVADRCRRLRSPAYTVHAGYRRNATLDQMIDTLKRLQDVFPCPVGVEGLYPRADQPQLMGTWREYERVLASGVPLAIDLSHLHIVATHEGRNDDLVRALLASPTTLEIHLSDNGGHRDSHDILSDRPWWWDFLHNVSPTATVFTEGNQLRHPHTTKGNHHAQ